MRTSTLVPILSAFCWVCFAQPPTCYVFAPKADIRVQNSREQGTHVTVQNNHSVTLTATVITMRRFYEDGRILIEWTRYLDSLITEPKPIFPGTAKTFNFGKQLIPHARLDEVIIRLVIFEDGSWIGDDEYLKRILNQRRAVRNALTQLNALGNSFDERNISITEAVRIPEEFSDDQERSASDHDERAAMVTGVRSFAGNMRSNYVPGKPVFTRGVKRYYEDWEKRLTESKPPI